MNGMTPGHLPSENLDPALQSYQTSGQPNANGAAAASGRSPSTALGAGLTLGVCTVLGALGTSLLAREHVGYALALSAGVTIYVAASDLIPEVNREGGAPLVWTVFGGLVLFVLVDWTLGALGAGH